MTAHVSTSRRLFLFVLLYAAIAMGGNLHYNSVSHDEALNILMGDQVFHGEACPNCDQHTGTTLIQPVLAYLGDQVAGLEGARFVSVLFGIGLIMVLYGTAKCLLNENMALLAALLSLFTGTIVYLGKLVTYDMAAAFFLALSFYLLVKSTQSAENGRRNFLLACGAISLFLAGISKYTLVVFWVPVAGYALWRHTFARWLFFFLIPLLVAAVFYFYLAIVPVLYVLSNSATHAYKEGNLGRIDLFSRYFRWLSVPYILAFFSFLHPDKAWRKIAFQLFLLSTPVVLLQLITGDNRSLDKNVIFALVFLAPCSAIGLDKMSGLFAFNSPGTWLKPFITMFLLIILWASSLTDLTWLERHFPDMTPVTGYLQKVGFNGMDVAIESDFGDPHVIYRYVLGHKFPAANFYSLSYVVARDRKNLIAQKKPNFIVLDEYYASEPLPVKLARYSSLGYALVNTFAIKLPWGNQIVQILKRG